MTTTTDGMWNAINRITKQFIHNRDDIVGMQLNGYRFQMDAPNGKLHVYHLEDDNWNLIYDVALNPPKV